MNDDGERVGVWRTGIATLIFGVIGMGLGALPALRVGGDSDWALPLAALTMAGLGAGTGAALRAELDHPFRLAVAGGGAGLAASTGAATVGAGIAAVSAAAVLLAVGWRPRQCDCVGADRSSPPLAVRPRAGRTARAGPRFGPARFGAFRFGGACAG